MILPVEKKKRNANPKPIPESRTIMKVVVIGCVALSKSEIYDPESWRKIEILWLKKYKSLRKLM